MNRSTASTMAYVVLLLVLVMLMPWRARSTLEFGPQAMEAIVVGILAYVLVRYGLEFLVVKEIDSHGSLPRLRPRMALKLSVAASLAIGLASIGLGTSHLPSGADAFFVCVIGQQLTITTIEIIVARQSVKVVKPVPRILTITALAVLALFFASASNITPLAQRPPVTPSYSNTTNLLFAMPAVIGP